MNKISSIIAVAAVQLLVVVACVGNNAYAQAPYYKFASGFIPAASSSCYPLSTAVDAIGNVYTSGFFTGTVDFDPGSGTQTLTSAGSNDIFVSKLDASGAYVWAKSFGSTGNDNSTGITVDGTGNVFTTGQFVGTVDFDPGSGTQNLTSASGANVFISKLDANGTYVWAKSFGASSANGIAVDGSGAIYTTGYFSNTVDFDPGSGTQNLTCAGGTDIFVSKLDASGSYVWAKRLGGSSTGFEVGSSIAVDSSNNVFTTGYFSGTADFDPGVSTQNLVSAGTEDIFVSKLDASGAYIWAKSFGGTSADHGNGISVDAAGNVYTTGYYQGTIDFDPGPGTQSQTSAGGADIFVSKLDASGAYVWGKSLGGTITDVAAGISVDGNGAVYTTGFLSGTADFDPGSGTQNLTSTSVYDIFVSKLDSNGAYVWAKNFGSTAYDEGTGIAIDGRGGVYTTGYFNGTVDFDPSASTANLSSGSVQGGFIQKLSQCSGAAIASVSASATQSTQPIGGNIQPLGLMSSCADIAKLSPSGSNKVAGSVTANVYIQSTAPTFNGQPFLRRTYDITSAANAGTATGTLTLYYTQADFTDYNTKSPLYPLPTGPSDAAGIANLRISQEHGTSITGLPGSYTSSLATKKVAINPADAYIVWNSILSRWEVSFDVTGFSGFFAFGGNNSAPLPIELISFTAAASASRNRLDWQSAAVYSGRAFYIERSVDGNDFTTIGSIIGSINNEVYTFYDQVPLSPIGYYRLRMTAPDGKTDISNTVVVRRDACCSGSITILPIPANGSMTVTCTDDALKGQRATVADMQGREVLRFIIEASQVIDVRTWNAGIYTLHLADGTVKQIVKQ